MVIKRIVLISVINCFGLIKGQSLDHPAGSACRRDNLTGTCVDARQCTTFISDVEAKTHPPICSFQGKYAIICCTACVIKDKVDPEPPLPKLVAKCRENYARLPYASSKLKIWKELAENGSCYQLQQIIDAPVGGADAGRDKHPHMVSCYTPRRIFYGDPISSVLLIEGYLLLRNSSWASPTRTWPLLFDVTDKPRVAPRAAASTTLVSSRCSATAHLKSQWLCAGSVISERYILTAAHCASQSQIGRVKFAATGILKRSDPPALWEVYFVQKFIPHPSYKSPSKYHDIALIETDKTIQFSASVLPACVGEGDLKDRRGVNYSEAHALAWTGQGPKGKSLDTLQLVTLEKFSTEECSALYPPHRFLARGFNSTTQTCYGLHTDDREMCGGDSGGPLLRLFKGLSCSAHIVGVTSYGSDCGMAGKAGIYTLVQYYEDWIKSVVFP